MKKSEHSPYKIRDFRAKYVERVEYLIDDKKTYGVSQNEMAKELGVSGAAITGWKSGTFANGEMLIAMSQYFDVRIDWLLGLDDNDSSPQKRDLVALTGLSDAAVKNLIAIRKEGLPFVEEMVSAVLASPHFLDLILSFVEITSLCDIVDPEKHSKAHLLEEGKKLRDKYGVDLVSEIEERPKTLPEMEDNLKLLKYSRYDIAEKCMMILNSIRPIDRILANGEEQIQSMIKKRAEEEGWK